MVETYPYNSYKSLELNQSSCELKKEATMSDSEQPKATEAPAHPTAVKAGGMRIVQDKSHLKRNTETPVQKPETDALNVSTSPPKQVELMSGATSKGDKDFSPEAVKVFHDKPVPKHQIPTHGPTNGIMQPRKGF